MWGPMFSVSIGCCCRCCCSAALCPCTRPCSIQSRSRCPVATVCLGKHTGRPLRLPIFDLLLLLWPHVQEATSSHPRMSAVTEMHMMWTMNLVREGRDEPPEPASSLELPSQLN